MQVSDNALHVLKHTLGLAPSRRVPHRNCFVAGPGHHDMPALSELEQAGLMTRAQTPGFCDPSDIVFLATDSGRDFAIEHLPPEPKLTKYDEYCRADCFDGFAEFLGIRKPKLEYRGGQRNLECRMYRDAWDADYGRWRDVQGEWASTKKAAKASYKEALKRSKENQR